VPIWHWCNERERKAKQEIIRKAVALEREDQLKELQEQLDFGYIYIDESIQLLTQEER